MALWDVLLKMAFPSKNLCLQAPLSVAVLTWSFQAFGIFILYEVHTHTYSREAAEPEEWSGTHTGSGNVQHSV